MRRIFSFLQDARSSAWLPGLMLTGLLVACQSEAMLVPTSVAETDFQTQALSSHYLGRKINRLVGENRSLEMQRELRYAQVKYPALARQVLCGQTQQLYTQMVNLPDVSSYRPGNAVFNSFVSSLDPSFQAVKLVNVNNTTGYDYSNYSFVVNFDPSSLVSGGLIDADYSRLVVLDDSNQPVPFMVWFHTGTPSLRVKLASLPNGVTRQLKIGIRNCQPYQHQAQAEQVLDLYDNFDANIGHWNTFDNISWQLSAANSQARSLKSSWAGSTLVNNQVLSVPMSANSGFHWSMRIWNPASDYSMTRTQFIYTDNTYDEAAVSVASVYHTFFNRVCAGSGSCPVVAPAGWHIQSATAFGNSQSYFWDGALLGAATNKNVNSKTVKQLNVRLENAGYIDYIALFKVRPGGPPAITLQNP